MELTGRWRMRLNWCGKMVLQVEEAEGRRVDPDLLQLRWVFKWRDARLTDFASLLEAQGVRKGNYSDGYDIPPRPAVRMPAPPKSR